MAREDNILTVVQLLLDSGRWLPREGDGSLPLTSEVAEAIIDTLDRDLEAVLDEVLPPYGTRFKKPILDAWRNP